MGNESNNMVMPVAPMGYGYGMPFGGMGGFGGLDMFGGNGWWIILLFLVLGRGFGGFGGGYGMGGGAPIIINNSDDDNNGGRGYNAVQRGFDQAAVMGGINGIQSAVTTGFGNVQTSLCSGFAGVNATVNGAQNAIAQQLYANQLSDLERSFAAQTASTQGMTALQSQLAQYCCDNRLATANLTATVLQENCADRAALENGVRDILTNQNANTQRLLDKLCDQELQAERRENANLRSELMYARGQASQIEQTAQIRAGQAAEVDALYNRLKNCPVGTYSVCNPTANIGGTCNGCGCGNGFTN